MKSRKGHYPNADCEGGGSCQCPPLARSRQALLEAIAEAGKRWWPSVRAKANHARMPRAELILWQAIRELMQHDGQDVG